MKSDLITKNTKDSLDEYFQEGVLTEDTKKMVRSLLERLNIGLGVSVVEQISRKNNLEKFVRAAEEVLFDPKRLNNMDIEDIQKLLTQANKNLYEITEFARKYIVQNKEILMQDVMVSEKGTITDIVKLLSTFPKSKLDTVLKTIDDISKNNVSEVVDL